MADINAASILAGVHGWDDVSPDSVADVNLRNLKASAWSAADLAYYPDERAAASAAAKVVVELAKVLVEGDQAMQLAMSAIHWGVAVAAKAHNYGKDA